MRWVRYESNGQPVYGIVEGDRVQPVTGAPFGDHERSGDTVALDSLKLLAPVIPATFYAAGIINYEATSARPPSCSVSSPTCPKNPTSDTAPTTPSSPTASR